MTNIDIHTHPFLFQYNRGRNINDVSIKGNPIFDKILNIIQHHTNVYKPQSNIMQMAKGDIKCVFISITPIEREYYLGKDFSQGINGIKKYLAKVGNKITSKNSPLRVILAMYVTSFPYSRIRTFQSKEYDYFEEFKKEMRLCLKYNDKLLNYTDEKCDKIKYSLTRNYDEVNSILISKNKNYKHLAFVLTLEGGHILTGGSREYKTNLDTMLERVWYLKNKLSYPVFFITLGHIFYNGLCGICRSLPDNNYWIADQEYGMNRKISREGDIVIKRLLNVDNKDKSRILIDINHMSLQARRDYYYKYIIPYNQKNRENKIPIIASHTAYSGIKSFREMEKITGNEIKGVRMGGRKYFCGSHNLTDEDIRYIDDSEGLIGLILSKRFLASRRRIKSIKNKKDPLEWGNIISTHIRLMISAMLNSKKNILIVDKRKVWDRICIGSDFDGFGETPEPFNSAEKMPLLKETLIQNLKDDRDFRDLLFGLDTEEIVDKFMFKNALNFLKRNY